MDEAGAERLELRRIALFSKAIAAIPHIRELVGCEAVVPRGRVRRGAESVDAVVGWGFKPTAAAARAFARREGIRYVALEDGFLRSAGNARAKPPPISIVLDDRGVYYEASGPSRLEALVAKAAADPAALVLGDRVRRRLLELKLTKYNTVSGAEADRLVPRRKRVMIVDQTFNDQAVAGAGADSSTFARMIADALAAHAVADILVKVHPDVLAGRARGYLATQAQACGIDLLADPVNPHDLFDRVDEIWTVSSGLGFEAALAGRTVRLYGAAFYAGWGLTRDDRIAPEVRALYDRRRCPVPVEALACAALVHYPRYADPVRMTVLDAFAAMDRLAEWREVFAARRDDVVAAGFSPRKRAVVESVFGGGTGRVTFVEPADAVERVAASNARLLLWDARPARTIEAAAREHGLAVTRITGGVLQCPERATEAVPLASVVLDDQGVPFDAARPSDFERLAETARFGPDLTARAAALRARLVGLADRAGGRAEALHAEIRAKSQGRRVVFVIPDAEGRAWSEWVEDIAAGPRLATAVRAARPSDFLVYVERPDLARWRKAGPFRSIAMRRAVDFVMRHPEPETLLAAADEVHVPASILGFHALLRGLPVVAWGTPFYAGWGLTEDRSALPRRTRRLSLDELTAAVLILAARYTDPVSGLPATPEDILFRAEAAARSAPVRHGFWTGLERRLGALANLFRRRGADRWPTRPRVRSRP